MSNHDPVKPLACTNNMLPPRFESTPFRRSDSETFAFVGPETKARTTFAVLPINLVTLIRVDFKAGSTTASVLATNTFQGMAMLPGNAYLLHGEKFKPQLKRRASKPSRCRSTSQKWRHVNWDSKPFKRAAA